MKKVLLSIIGGILGILVLFFGIEGLTRFSLNDDPTVEHVTNVATPDRGVVYLNGAGTPRMIIDDLWPFFTQQGNFEEVVYSPELFNRKKVINLVIEKIKPYSHVTFVGASMGGMVAHDVIHELRNRGDQRHFGVIFVDSPTGKWSDVGGVPSWTKPLACLPFGVISNQFGLTPRPQADLSQIHPKDPKKLKILWDQYAAYPWSGYSDQGCYVFWHEDLQPLKGVTAVYIRSKKDTFVLDSAIEGWRAVVPLKEVFYVNATHMSFMDEPTAYEQAFQKGFAAVAA